MMEATPTTIFAVTEADLLFEFEIVALDPPAATPSGDSISSHSSGAGSLGLASLWAGRTRHRVNREDSGVLLPSRHLICCQPSAESSRPSVFADTGRCVASRRNRWPGRPRPERDAGANGASPGRQTIVVGRMPAT
jgi:hypothetical protein